MKSPNPVLLDGEVLRYSRTLALRDFDVDSQLRLRSSSVLVCGAGGLSSSFLPAIVASGVGSVHVVDFDRVELSNLQRQVLFSEVDLGRPKVAVVEASLAGLNSGARIVGHEFAVSPEAEGRLLDIASQCDYLVDLTDSVSSRVILNRLSVRLKKTFFTAAAIGFRGHVYVFEGFRIDSSCYRCLFPDVSELDASGHSCEDLGVFPVSPLFAGSLLASEFLKVAGALYDDYEAYVSRLVRFDLLKNEFAKSYIKKDPSCCICSA